MADLQVVLGNDTGKGAIQKLDSNIKAVNQAVENIDISDLIVNNLVTTDTTKALAAPQGKLLAEQLSILSSDKIDKTQIKNDLLQTAAGNVLDSRQGKVLDNKIATLSNPLKDKKWTVLGDSITEYNFATTKNYHGYIADWCGCTIQNLGVGGMGYSSIVNIYSQFGSINADADYITIMAGTNDYGLNAKPLGAFGSLSADNIAGSILYCLVMFQNNYWNKKLGVISPLPRIDNYGENAIANSQGVTLKMINDILSKTCRHLSIPYLDLYSGSGLYPWTSACSAGYFSNPVHPSGDGLHPNALGHAMIARKILDFMVSL